MTCFAITIGETCLSGLGTTCHPEDGTYLKVGRTFLSARLNSWHGNGDPAFAQNDMPCTGRRPMSPRKCVYRVFALRTIEWKGDSSTSLRMTCFAITIGETCLSGLGTTCHPEEGLSAVPGTGRRQADEGSTAALIHPCATCTCRYLREAAREALLPSPRRGGAGGGVSVLTGYIESDAAAQSDGGSGDSDD